MTVADIVELYEGKGEGADLDRLRRAVRLDALSESWRSDFRQRIDEYGGRNPH